MPNIIQYTYFKTIQPIIELMFFDHSGLNFVVNFVFFGGLVVGAFLLLLFFTQNKILYLPGISLRFNFSYWWDA